MRTTYSLLMLALVMAMGCVAPDPSPARSMLGDGATGTLTTPAQWPSRYGLGAPASPDAIAALDTDVDTTGAGLPEGHGTAAEGALVYAARCASCHGAKGEGVAPAPALVVPLSPTDSFPWARSAQVPKTIGNYWPFATTMYAYVRHSMPQSAPGSLSAAEVYQVVAWLLAENGVMAHDAVLDASSLAAIKLPMRARFVPDNRRGGAEFK